MSGLLRLLGTTTLVVLTSLANGQNPVVIETVTVGHPGNPGELSGEGAGGEGPDRICGAVDYVYEIARFEVTASQYTDFLNAVAATDTYTLYSTVMMDTSGCRIERAGVPGSYSYSVPPEFAERPVNIVTWADAARFANWLHNGQPVGAQDLTTTEDGSYFLDGATSDDELIAVARQPDATWVIPSEDEWYKAAYHLDDGVTGNYYDYPTSCDCGPSNDLIDPDPGNSANFWDGDYTLGPPQFRTVVGEFELSGSPYGTFDQGGNVREWNEAVLIGWGRGLRGSAYLAPVDLMHAAYRDNFDSPGLYDNSSVGFRVAYLGTSTELFIRGDSDGDGAFSALIDGLYTLGYGFQGGDPPPCMEAADADGNGSVTALIDGLYTLNFGFAGGPPPPAPFPGCGVDPDPDQSLGCAVLPACP